MSAHTGTPRGSGEQRFDLHGVVVTYEDGPDRCTVYPRGAAHQDRLGTWLSADLDAFDSLREMR